MVLGSSSSFPGVFTFRWLDEGVGSDDFLKGVVSARYLSGHRICSLFDPDVSHAGLAVAVPFEDLFMLTLTEDKVRVVFDAH